MVIIPSLFHCDNWFGIASARGHVLEVQLPTDVHLENCNPEILVYTSCFYLLYTAYRIAYTSLFSGESFFHTQRDC